MLKSIAQGEMEYPSVFVLVLLTHGNEGYVVGSDNKQVELAWIYELFNNDNCTPLRGKPKLFFIDACRGGQ